MGLIPPVSPLFYIFAFLAFLLLILTLIALLRSKQTSWVKALFFGCACCLQVVTIIYPIFLYSNKTAPLSSSSLIIGIGQDGRIVALNARDGSVRWTQSSRGSVTAGPGNMLYAVSQTNDGASVITAMTASNGQQAWRAALLPQQSYGTLQNLMTSNGFVYVDEATGYADEVVYALRANDGSLAWKHAEHITDRLDEFLLMTAGNGLVFVRAQDDSFSALHANDGSLAWHFSPAIPQGSIVLASQLVLAEQNVYYLQSAGGQDISLFALTQGRGKLVWQKRMQGSNVYANGLASAGTHLYLSINAQTILLSALNGAQLWHSSLDSGFDIAVTEADGLAYIPGNNALNALDEHSGRVLWSLPADPDGDFTAPVLFQNTLFASAQAIRPHGFFGTGASGQDAVVAINSSNGSVYWSTANAASLIGIFNLS